MKWHDEQLKILGLSSTETSILECTKTAKSIQEIADDSGLSRTGIKHCLESLQKRELVKKYRHGKRSVYVGIQVMDLARKLEYVSHTIRIEDGGIKGARVRTSKENEFTIYVGSKEIIPAYSRIASINRNERVKAIQHHKSYKEIVEKVSSRLLSEFNGAIIKNNIILDGLLNESAYRTYAEEIKSNPTKFKRSIESLEGRMADYHVFPDNIFNFDAEIWIFKTTTLIINWKEEIAIEMTNSNMTGFLGDMFEYVKSGSRKIDHNKMIREVINNPVNNHPL